MDHFLEVFDGQDLLDFSSPGPGKIMIQTQIHKREGWGPTRHKIYLLGALLQEVRSVEGSIKRGFRVHGYTKHMGAMGCLKYMKYSKMLKIPVEPISWLLFDTACVGGSWRMQRPRHIVTETCHD